MAEVSLYPGALDSTNIYEVVARLSTTLTADITAATTTIPLASTTGFPTKGNIVIDNETIAYISVSVGSVDATGGRGKAGTAASHTNTTQVLYAVTAADFNKLRAGLIAVQTELGIGGTRLRSKTITATRDLAAAGAPSDVAYTGVGFTPTAIVCLYSVPGSLFGIGVSDSAKTSQTNYQEYSGAGDKAAFLLLINQALNALQSAAVKTFDADGFTLTWTKTGSPTGTSYLTFLCFR